MHKLLAIERVWFILLPSAVNCLQRVLDVKSVIIYLMQRSAAGEFLSQTNLEITHIYFYLLISEDIKSPCLIFGFLLGFSKNILQHEKTKIIETCLLLKSVQKIIKNN